ncbi:Uncharacterized protein HZ326_13031 [Fusarium oxysporum f. sp. albedinis]|nr:Uncharacterized protein HZ326_13031 [Fusarium oxysporum f. sp. albedinis]
MGYRLCFACAVNVFKRKSCDVIALAAEISSEIIIQWTDKYGIAATKLPPAKFSVFTPISDINLGQKYTLPQDGSLGTVVKSTDPDAPMHGFRFFNKADKASPVVYQTSNGQKSPVCFTDDFIW